MSLTTEQHIAFDEASIAFGRLVELTPQENQRALLALSDASARLADWKRRIEAAEDDRREAQLLAEFRNDMAAAGGETIMPDSPMEQMCFRWWKAGRQRGKPQEGGKKQ